MRWECRHASAEMLYLEVGDDEVLEWFDHHPDEPTRWSFTAVLDGALDDKISALWDDEVLAQLKTEVRRRRRP